MAGEAEVDEPLAVEGAGHRLQNLDPPLAVLDQFVVGRQGPRDAALDGEGGKRKLKAPHCFLIAAWHLGSLRCRDGGLDEVIAREDIVEILAVKLSAIFRTKDNHVG